MSQYQPVIAIVGAGSLVWGRQIALDLLLDPTLDGADLRLMDVDAGRLDLVQRYISAATQDRGWRKTVTATTDLSVALKNATHVITGISVGGDHLWRFDAMFPQIYGIYQAVGDTIGPGGAIRALRHAPPLMKVARTLAQVGEPGATLIQVSNPMNVLCGAMSQVEGIQVLGFCHGFDDTENIIAHTLGVPRSDVRVKLAGNNHFVAADEIAIGNTVYDQSTIGSLFPKIADGTFRDEFFKRYGVYIGNHMRHPAEFVPDFLTREHGFGRAWNIAPIPGEVDPANPSRQDRSIQDLQKILSDADKDPVGHGPAGWSIAASREPLNHIISALIHGTSFETHLNIPNQGAISGVAPNANVEVYCHIANRQIHRRQVTFPPAFTREVARVAQEQALLAEACTNFSEDRILDALMLDALVPKDRDLIRTMIRTMVDYQRDWIHSSR